MKTLNKVYRVSDENNGLDTNISALYRLKGVCPNINLTLADCLLGYFCSLSPRLKQIIICHSAVTFNISTLKGKNKANAFLYIDYIQGRWMRNVLYQTV